MTELRCPAAARHLLGKVTGDDPAVRIQIACLGCRHALRKDGERISTVLYTFTLDGTVTDHKVLPVREGDR